MSYHGIEAFVYSNFSLNNRARSIEDGVKKCVDNYFNQLYTSLNEIFGKEQNKQKKQIINRLENQKQPFLNSISDSFPRFLSNRISNSDKEYNEILKLPDSPIKEEIKRDFRVAVFQEGSDKLCEDMKRFVTVVCDELDEELDHFIADQQKLVDYYAQKLEGMARIRSGEAGKQRLSEFENEQAELVKRVEAVKQQARERIDELEKSIRNLAAEKGVSDSKNG